MTEQTEGKKNSARITFKDRASEVRIFRRRIIACAVVMGLLTMIIVARLAELQIIDYMHYTTLSQENRVKLVPIVPSRGMIFSRDGKVLAENHPSFALEVMPGRVPDFNQAVADLRQFIILTDEDLARYSVLLRRKRRFENVPIRLNLSEEEVARFSVNRHRFPGFDIVVYLNRYYPQGEQMAHLVGYVGRIDERELKGLDPGNYSATTHIGKTGVEKYYEETLHGKVGYQQVEVNAQGRVMRVLEKVLPVAGKNLHLALDMGAQATALEALGQRKGAVVALDIESGGVLAFVSWPSFDPNLFTNGISQATYLQLRDAPDRPLFNRAMQASYPPGSTVKPFMAFAGLEAGVRTPSQLSFCPGFYRLHGQAHQFRCWRKSGHGGVNMRRAIAQSCDVYFYVLAQTLGIDRMHHYFSQFSFGRRTAIDLPAESTGLYPSEEWKRRVRHKPWMPGETLIAGIGQGYVLTTPVQLAAATATLANRGHALKPTVVGKIEDLTTHTVIDNTHREAEQQVTMRPNTWTEIINDMGAVTQGGGTAGNIGINAPYRFGGKTGTAQVFGIKQNQRYNRNAVAAKLRDHALFIAFAPLDKPKIAVAVIVENGEHGNTAAAPVARKLLDHLLLGPAAPTPAVPAGKHG